MMNNGEIKIAFGEDGKAHMLNDDYAIYCADEETFLKVKQAVERSQKMPVQYNDEGLDLCPKCGSWDLLSGDEFCSRCGQALDWSEFREA